MLLLATTHDDCQAALEVSSSFRRLKMIFVQPVLRRKIDAADGTRDAKSSSFLQKALQRQCFSHLTIMPYGSTYSLAQTTGLLLVECK